MGAFVPPPFEIPADLDTQLRQLGPLLDAGSAVHELGQTALARLHQEFDGRPFTSKYQGVAYLIFCKGFKTFQAAWNLCLCGCGADALGLCASLFENIVDLLYIAQAPMRRPLRYIQFEQVEKYRQCEKILKRKRLPKGVRNTWKERLSSLAPFAVFLQFFPKKHAGWSGKSVRERARSVRLDLEYDDLYHIFCAYKHTTPGAAYGLMFGHNDGVDVIVGPHIRGVFDGALHSAVLMLRLIDIFQSAFQFAMGADVAARKQALSTAADRVVSAVPEDQR